MTTLVGHTPTASTASAVLRRWATRPAGIAAAVVLTAGAALTVATQTTAGQATAGHTIPGACERVRATRPTLAGLHATAGHGPATTQATQRATLLRLSADYATAAAIHGMPENQVHEFGNIARVLAMAAHDLTSPATATLATRRIAASDMLTDSVAAWCSDHLPPA